MIVYYCKVLNFTIQMGRIAPYFLKQFISVPNSLKICSDPWPSNKTDKNDTQKTPWGLMRFFWMRIFKDHGIVCKDAWFPFSTFIYRKAQQSLRLLLPLPHIIILDFPHSNLLNKLKGVFPR